MKEEFISLLYKLGFKISWDREAFSMAQYHHVVVTPREIEKQETVEQLKNLLKIRFKNLVQALEANYEDICGKIEREEKITADYVPPVEIDDE